MTDYRHQFQQGCRQVFLAPQKVVPKDQKLADTFRGVTRTTREDLRRLCSLYKGLRMRPGRRAVYVLWILPKNHSMHQWAANPGKCQMTASVCFAGLAGETLVRSGKACCSTLVERPDGLRWRLKCSKVWSLFTIRSKCLYLGSTPSSCQVFQNIAQPWPKQQTRMDGNFNEGLRFVLQEKRQTWIAETSCWSCRCSRGSHLTQMSLLLKDAWRNRIFFSTIGDSVRPTKLLG